MNDYIKASSCLREIRALVASALTSFEYSDETEVPAQKRELVIQIQRLQDVWRDGKAPKALIDLKRHADFSEPHDYKDMQSRDIPALEEALDSYLRSIRKEQKRTDFTAFLHPTIVEYCLHHYEDEDYREAVLNAMLALAEAIRERTNLDMDGVALASTAFRPDAPLLVFSELTTQSGHDDQDGFHQIMRGAFIGIRNPKAHSLRHDLTAESAAQYLVFISLLLRRVDECKTAPKPPAKAKRAVKKRRP